MAIVLVDYDVNTKFDKNIIFFVLIIILHLLMGSSGRFLCVAPNIFALQIK
ncbi:MAG: hypothetical protein KJ736_00750 [Candidatus Omnitrophica bacterium]|nr:hypothetical protein [Candidatus Omnitrophota bacterium]